MKKISWLAPDTYKGDHLLYRHWVTEAWQRAGGNLYQGMSIPWKYKQIAGKANFLASMVPSCLKNKALLVCCGAHPNYSAFPYNYSHEIVPVIWDCWPKYHQALFASIRQNKIRTLFCTSSQVVELIKSKFPYINAFWLPEGIDPSFYSNGEPLRERQIDILELGRQLPGLHQEILKENKHNKFIHKYSEENKLLFKTQQDLATGLSDAKITICYPRCDTHPSMAGGIETMTQRYWECMLSGTLIVGRAPKELIRFCGYNPVIELPENNSTNLFDILEHIESYQKLCNKNYQFALANSSWDSRMRTIIETLSDMEYII